MSDDPSRIVIFDGNEIRTSSEMLEALRDHTVRVEDGTLLMTFDHRVIAMPHDELARMAERSGSILLADDIAATIRERAESIGHLFEQLAYLPKQVAVDPEGLPRGASAKPMQPAPKRTGLREAARRRRQMEKRARKAA